MKMEENEEKKQNSDQLSKLYKDLQKHRKRLRTCADALDRGDTSFKHTSSTIFTQVVHVLTKTREIILGQKKFVYIFFEVACAKVDFLR